jgi:hypothetical protein
MAEDLVKRHAGNNAPTNGKRGRFVICRAKLSKMLANKSEMTPVDLRNVGLMKGSLR